jgi:hypothetical protein
MRAMLIRSKILPFISFLLLLVLIYLLSEKFAQPIEDEPPQAISQISFLDILDNPEFNQKMSEAVLENDIAAMEVLQNRAIEIANVAGLESSQMELLVGERGLHFIVFRVKRQLFADLFSEHYMQLKPISELKLRFPEAQDLFTRADQLIQERDESIKRIAIELSSEANYQGHLQQAKKQWLDLANQPESINN